MSTLLSLLILLYFPLKGVARPIRLSNPRSIFGHLDIDWTRNIMLELSPTGLIKIQNTQKGGFYNE